ncbi:MAG: hypothetical protein AAB897_01835 [Patescibacteria group bacterium]
MRIILGHVGEIRAGKGTVGDLIDLWLKENGFTGARESFGGILRETLGRLQMLRQNGWTANGGLGLCILREILSIWSIENTDSNLFLLAKTLFSDKGYGYGHVETNRHNLQKLAQIMVEPDAFGPYALAHAVAQRAIKRPVQVIQLDGVRWLEDEETIRTFTGYRNEEHPDIFGIILYTTADFYVRLKRANERKREGEAGLTEEQARRDEEQKNEIYIPQIGSRADWKIVNNYDTLEPLKEDVYKFCEMFIRTVLEPNDSYI